MALSSRSGAIHGPRRLEHAEAQPRCASHAGRAVLLTAFISRLRGQRNRRGGGIGERLRSDSDETFAVPQPADRAKG